MAENDDTFTSCHIRPDSFIRSGGLCEIRDTEQRQRLRNANDIDDNSQRRAYEFIRVKQAAADAKDVWYFEWRRNRVDAMLR